MKGFVLMTMSYDDYERQAINNALIYNRACLLEEELTKI